MCTLYGTLYHPCGPRWGIQNSSLESAGVRAGSRVLPPGFAGDMPERIVVGVDVVPGRQVAVDRARVVDDL